MTTDNEQQESKQPTVIHLTEVTKDMTKEQRRQLAEKFAAALLK